MIDASQYLYTLSEQIAQPYIALPTMRAAMVTGSVAKGLADTYSDIDMTMYYDAEIPDEETLLTIRTGHGAPERKWTLGDRESGWFAEAYDVAGIEVQIGHTTVAGWEETMRKVLEELEEFDSPVQKALEGTLACNALYGKDLLNRWKAQIANYPPALAEAMVKKHLAFFPVWGLEPHFRTRDATLWYYQILVEAAQNLIGVLAGLNRLYFTTFQFKRMQYFIDAMEIVPTNLATRLEGVFRQEMSTAVTELESLVADTVRLVEQHMPQIDTTAAKRRIGWRIEPWTPREDALPVTH